MGVLALALLVLAVGDEFDKGTSVAAGNVLNLSPVDMPISDETGE